MKPPSFDDFDDISFDDLQSVTRSIKDNYDDDSISIASFTTNFDDEVSRDKLSFDDTYNKYYLFITSCRATNLK
jgi:hypothetical protein